MDTAVMSPVVGRIVLYQMRLSRVDAYPSVTYPAMVIASRPGQIVDLNVFTHKGAEVVHNAEFSKDGEDNHWSLPSHPIVSKQA